MLREIGDAVEAITAQRPLLITLEDLHWVDPSTVDLLSALARRRLPARLMLIGSCRPVDLGRCTDNRLGSTFAKNSAQPVHLRLS